MVAGYKHQTLYEKITGWLYVLLVDRSRSLFVPEMLCFQESLSFYCAPAVLSHCSSVFTEQYVSIGLCTVERWN